MLGKDPSDHEANYRKPIRRSEMVRLLLRGLVVGAAFLWFRRYGPPRLPMNFGIADAASSKGLVQPQEHEGAAAAIALGWCLLAFGVIGVVAAARGELEEIFVSGNRRQIALQGALTTLGGAVMAAGIVALH